MKRKLGELLIEAGAATSEDVDLALSDQSAGEPSRLGDMLLSTAKVTATALAHALAIQYHLPYASLSYVDPEASQLIPLEFQRSHKLVLFRLDRDGGATRVHVALADPTLVDVVDELRAQLNREVIVHIASVDHIESVHADLSGESLEEPVVMGEALDEEVMPVDPGITAERSLAEGHSNDFLFPVDAAVAPTRTPSLLFDGFKVPPPAPGDGEVDWFAVESPAVEEAELPSIDGFAGGSPEPQPLGIAEQASANAAKTDWGDAAEASVELEPFDFSAEPPPAVEPSPPVGSPTEASDLFDYSGGVAMDPGPMVATAPEPIRSPVPAYGLNSGSASVTAEELFGSLDLGLSSEEAPLSTDLADEIGRHDSVPEQKFTGFEALSAPLGELGADRFSAQTASPSLEPLPITGEHAALVDADTAPLLEADIDVGEPAVSPEPPPIPSFAISPEVPVEPHRSLEPLRRPSTLGRIALKRVAVNREGGVVAVAGAPVTPQPLPVVEDSAPAELALPAWMQALEKTVETDTLTPQLIELLARVESGGLPAGTVVAALLRLLVQRGVIDDAALTAALEKL